MAVKSFELRLYRGRNTDGEPEFSVSGSGDEWENYQRVRVPGFDGSVSISLEGFWAAVLEQQLHDATAEVTGYETIVKFGDTQQLKEDFTVVVQVAYA